MDYAAGNFSRGTLGPYATARGTPLDRYWKMISQLDALMRELPMAQLYTCDLARRIGTSPRTLQAAVQAVFGVSLHRYVRLMKLWSAHCQLQNGCQSVKAAALGNGLYHLSEFSRLYKDTFGEKPSETLARARLRRQHVSSIGDISPT